MRSTRLVCCWVFVLFSAGVVSAADGNRLAYLNDFCDPYYVGVETARFVTPQWIGEEGVDTAFILSTDDLRDSARHEAYLRPILERLKKIDGRGPISLMANRVEPGDPRLARWYEEGANMETHTYDHPCPCLGKNDFEKAKGTYDRCVDMMVEFSGGRAKAFRMPCCDSMNTASPRFFHEIFNKTTPKGNFQVIDSSVFQVPTAADPALPRDLIAQQDRFSKYMPPDRKFVNYVQDYPYPYVIDRLCWEMPASTPDDWQGFNLQGAFSEATVGDMKASIDAAVLKQGIYVLVFHAGGWIRNHQVVQLVDHAVEKHGKKVKFLNFLEAYERLTRNALGGNPLRTAAGQDNGVRVLDLNNDGFMDVVIGNEKVRQTRIWSPKRQQWITTDFPVEIVSVDGQGNRRESGVRFGVLQANGYASLLVGNEKTAGVWHFDGQRWQADPRGLAGLELGGPATSRNGRDQGVRLRDLDRDGICELIVGNPQQQGVYQWLGEQHGWKKLPFTLPAGAVIVDAQGRDAGCRLVDINEDGHPDVVFSNPERCSLDLFVSMAEGWSRKVLAARRGEGGDLPMIVRADGSNNGVWFKYRRLWVHNEDVGEMVKIDGKPILIPVDSRLYATLLEGQGHAPRRAPRN